MADQYEWAETVAGYPIKADFDRTPEPGIDMYVTGEGGEGYWAPADRAWRDYLYENTNVDEKYELYQKTQGNWMAEYGDVAPVGPYPAQDLTVDQPDSAEDVYFGVQGASNPFEAIGMFGGDVITHPTAPFGPAGAGWAVLDTVAEHDLAPDSIDEPVEAITSFGSDSMDLMKDMMPMLAAMMPMMMMMGMMGAVQGFMRR